MPMGMKQYLVTEISRGRSYDGLWFCPTEEILDLKMLLKRQHMDGKDVTHPHDLFVLEKSASGGCFYSAVYRDGFSVLMQAASFEMALMLLQALSRRGLVPECRLTGVYPAGLSFVAVASLSHFKTNRRTSLHSRHYWSTESLGEADGKEPRRRRWYVFPDTGIGELDLSGLSLQ